MKKIISIILSASLFGSIAFASRTDQAAELRTLISEAESLGYTVDYEKSAAAVFEAFTDIEETDAADETRTDEQREYNIQSMDRIYNSTKSALQSYISGADKPFPAIDFPDASERNISGSTFVDANGKPLQSVGFGHFDNVVRDAEMLKEAGSNNIQNEIGPSFFCGSTSVKLWEVTKNNGCDADVTVAEEEDGNHVLQVENRVSDAVVPDTYVLIRQYVPVQPNTNYLISFEADSSEETTMILLPDGWNTRHTFTVGAERKKYSVSSRYTTAEDQYYTEFMIIVNRAVTMNFDNITLQNMKTKENVIKNPDFEAENYGYYFTNLSVLFDRLEPMQEAADKGFSVDLLISPHYFPTFMLEAYPEIQLGSAGTFLNYNINHPIARQFIADYLHFILPFVANYDGIDSICLSNEPNFRCTQAYEYYDPIFREWMIEKYSNDISKVNEAYGSEIYTSFDEISMPSYLYNVNGRPRSDPLYYDYSAFNEENFASWHKFMADIVKSYLPDMPLHAKMQDYLFFEDYYSIAKMNAGTDVELFAEFSDIIGNDAVTYYGTEYSNLGVMMWYDFISSVTGKPVYNSEDHVIKDGNTDYSDNQAQNVRASLFNGAIHGRNASTLWLWQENHMRGIFNDMPYAMYLTTKTMLDMTRLTNEINAFRTADKDTAFFYSKSSRVKTIYNTWDSSHEEALYEGYKAVSALGHKTGFVTQRTPEKMHNYKTLILADVQALPEESVAEIVTFMENGGNVIIDGTDCLAYSEYGAATGSDDRTYILNNAYYVSESTPEAYNNAYLYFGETGSFVKENEAVAAGIDLKTAEHDGEELIYIMNVSDAVKNVTLDSPGIYTNLVSGDSVNETLTLTPYEPVMLKVEALNNNAEITAVFDADSADFEVTYTTDTECSVKMVVAMRNADGDIVGFAYCGKQAFAEDDNTFTGSVNCAEGVSAEVVVFDAVTGAELCRNSANP